MKQLNLFTLPEKSEQAGTHWKLCVDGASRNNPGPAGAGVYISNDGVPVVQEGFYLGTKTNNQAEYYALLLGLYLIKQRLQPHDTVLIISDSQLLIRQLQGHYRVKHPDLQPLHAIAKKVMRTMHVDVEHVLREQNTKADALANKGVDEKKAVPQEFFDWFKVHSD